MNVRSIFLKAAQMLAHPPGVSARSGSGRGAKRMTALGNMKRRLASGWSKSLKIRCTVSGRRVVWSN
jgi:hypothetical protein